MTIICNLLRVYLFLIFARIVLSWFPLNPSGAMAGIYSFLYTVTEPVLGPVRRIMPALGAFDLSPIVVIIGISIIQGALGC